MRLFLFLLACSGTQDPLVVVSVNSPTPLYAIQSLAASVTAAGHASDFSVSFADAGSFAIPPAHTFGVEVPETFAGAFHLTLRALAADGSQLAQGAGDAMTRVGERSDLEITLGP